MVNSQINGDLLDVGQACELLGISRVHLSYLRRKARRPIPCLKISPRCYRYRRDDLLAWMAANAADEKAPPRARRPRKKARTR